MTQRIECNLEIQALFSAIPVTTSRRLNAYRFTARGSLNHSAFYVSQEQHRAAIDDPLLTQAGGNPNDYRNLLTRRLYLL